MARQQALHAIAVLPGPEPALNECRNPGIQADVQMVQLHRYVLVHRLLVHRLLPYPHDRGALATLLSARKFAACDVYYRPYDPGTESTGSQLH